MNKKSLIQEKKKLLSIKKSLLEKKLSLISESDSIHPNYENVVSNIVEECLHLKGDLQQLNIYVDKIINSFSTLEGSERVDTDDTELEESDVVSLRNSVDTICNMFTDLEYVDYPNALAKQIGKISANNLVKKFRKSKGF